MFNTLPGHDNYVEITSYTTTEYESRVFCDSDCVQEYLDDGGVL